MEDDELRTMVPIENSGRFHFDPQHDPATVPSRSDIVDWAAGQMQVEKGHVWEAVQGELRKESRTGGLKRVLRWIPALRRRHEARVRKTCLDAIAATLPDMHALAREYAVDPLTHHSLGPVMKGYVSLAVYEMTNREMRVFVDTHPDQADVGIAQIRAMLDEMDTERRRRDYLRGAKETLENEALINLLTSDQLTGDKQRQIAAFEAALDEVRNEEMLTAIRNALNRLGTVATKWRPQ